LNHLLIKSKSRSRIVKLRFHIKHLSLEDLTWSEKNTPFYSSSGYPWFKRFTNKITSSSANNESLITQTINVPYSCFCGIVLFKRDTKAYQ